MDGEERKRESQHLHESRRQSDKKIQTEQTEHKTVIKQSSVREM